MSLEPGKGNVQAFLIAVTRKNGVENSAVRLRTMAEICVFGASSKADMCAQAMAWQTSGVLAAETDQ
eukprot:3235412-Amphidinium_carterae.1